MAVTSPGAGSACRLLSGLATGQFLSADQSLDTSQELSPWHQDASSAATTPDADIGPKPDNLPLVAATGVGLAHAHHVAKVDFIIHGVYFWRSAGVLE